MTFLGIPLIPLVLAIYLALAAVGGWSAFSPESQRAATRQALRDAYDAETARIQARRQRLTDGAYVGCRSTCYA